MTEDEVFEKELNQLDKVDESVDKVIKNMGTLYKKVIDKLTKDNICFLTKEKLDKEFDIIAIPDKKLEKGMIAFVAINKNENK